METENNNILYVHWLIFYCLEMFSEHWFPAEFGVSGALTPIILSVLFRAFIKYNFTRATLKFLQWLNLLTRRLKTQSDVHFAFYICDIISGYFQKQSVLLTEYIIVLNSIFASLNIRLIPHEIDWQVSTLPSDILCSPTLSETSVRRRNCSHLAWTLEPVKC